MSFNRREAQEQGFMLLALIVAIFLILLVLSVAAPTVAHELRREREVETVRRGNQYVRAIELYYLKFNHYPGSIEELEKTNNVRFLRQRYVDPMTGKSDWRLIKVGEAKTTVKGFFGKPLAGLAPGLGSAAGMASPGGIGAGAAGSAGLGSAPGSGSMGSPLGGSTGPGAASPGLGSPGPATGPTTDGGAPAAGGSRDSSGFGSSGGIGSQSASSFTGAAGPFVGVGLVKEGDSILTLNEQTTYPTWEFIYDPRIEQMKAKASLFGGGPASTDAAGLGAASSTGSGFGSTSGTGFGSPGGTGAGTGTSPAPTTTGGPTGPTGPTTTPQ
jgi:type II secretory pathway pseudopilin PulG